MCCFIQYIVLYASFCAPYMDINEVFGKKVLERRLSLKISQETLANMADIDRTYLPDIEKGKRNVSLRVADKIAKALNVSLKDLL